MTAGGAPGARWGLTIPVGGVPLPAHADLVRALPSFGYTDAWSAETAGADAFTPLALASAWAPDLRLGTAIVPVFTRGPALIAMSAAALADAAPGRFVLGLGASSPVIVGNWNGIAFDRPYQRTRDVLRFVRAALAGERVDGEFDTFRVQAVQAGAAAGPAAADPARRAATADARAGGAGGRRRDPELAGCGGRRAVPARRSPTPKPRSSPASSSARPRTPATPTRWPER